VNAVLEEPETRNIVARQGTALVSGPPERLRELVVSELARWKRVVSEAGIKPE
jgi:tripartite-type tricarboxylate transporter receptor subunit TctC